MGVKHSDYPLRSASPRRVSSTKQVKKSASHLNLVLDFRIKRLVPIGLTAVWFLFLLLLSFLFNNYGNEFRPSPEVLVVFVIVFVGYLIFSGRVAEIGGAGWVVRLRNISQSTVSIQRIRESLNPSVRVDKGSIEHLKREIIPTLMSEPISTLSLKKGLGYDSYTLWEYLGYLKSLPTFHDVIFVDELRHFQGWIDPQALLNLLNYIETRAPMERLLNNWELAKIP